MSSRWEPGAPWDANKLYLANLDDLAARVAGEVLPDVDVIDTLPSSYEVVTPLDAS